MSVFDLWLPILATGIATHIASTIAWMALPHHKPEWRKLPVEDELQDWLDSKNVAAEQYLFPHTHDPEVMKSEDFQHKMQSKCRGMLILWPEPVNMGAAIGKTLAFFFVAAFMIGYLTSLASLDGSFMDVFRFTFTAALLTHCAGEFPGVFWFRRKVAMSLLDGLAFAIITGLLFAWLWPSVNVAATALAS